VHFLLTYFWAGQFWKANILQNSVIPNISNPYLWDGKKLLRVPKRDDGVHFIPMELIKFQERKYFTSSTSRSL
jgi:hypothetical protein